MPPSQILADAAHRPWPLPASPWAVAMKWHDLLFAHWPVAADALRSHIPAGLEIDTFDATAWLGVVPFRMSGVRPRGTPTLPWFSAFPELNVRTYVKACGKQGVWFFSLDAHNPVAVAVARRWYHLPYFRAEMRCAASTYVEYESRRTHRGAAAAEFRARYLPAGPVQPSQPGTLEYFLTERYCLYAADPRGRVYRGDVHHAPWPLQPAEAEISANTMALASGFTLPARPPLLHFARRLDVVAWALTPVEA